MFRAILSALVAVSVMAVPAAYARQRVSTATIYVDWVNGDDARDCSNPSEACKTLQVAFDRACADFDLFPPYTWSPIPGSYYGQRVGITIQMAPAPATNSYRIQQPIYVDGQGCAGPITLRGNPAAPTNYYVYCANTFQGLTAQNGARVNYVGFAIYGMQDCTFINMLAGGHASISHVWFGPPGNGVSGGAIGAAGGGSRVDVIGPTYFWGSGFSAVFAAIEGGEIVLAPGNSINATNAMNFGVMFAFWSGTAWTQGSPPVFNGWSGSTGLKYSLSAHSFIGFAQSLIPGYGAYIDATSSAPF